MIYGIRAKERYFEKTDIKCPRCGAEGLEMRIFVEYAHMMWIPTLPIGKTAVTYCTSCRETLKPEQMPRSLKVQYGNRKSLARPLLWMYSGLGVIAILSVIIIAGIIRKQQRTARYMKDLQKGDILEIKRTANAYTLFKIAAIRSDSVFVMTNRYETNKESGLSEIKDKDPFTGEVLLFLKKDLNKMYKDGKIVGVER